MNGKERRERIGKPANTDAGNRKASDNDRGRPHRTDNAKNPSANAMDSRGDLRVGTNGANLLDDKSINRKSFWEVANQAIHRWLMLAIGVLFGTVIVYSVAWFFEPPVFSLRSIEVPDIVEGRSLRVVVKSTVRNRCTYLVEYSVWQKQVTNNRIYLVKLHGGREWREAPVARGPRDYVIPIRLREPPKIGTAQYQERIGSVCNPLRMLWPIWTEWKSVTFRVWAPVSPQR